MSNQEPTNNDENIILPSMTSSSLYTETEEESLSGMQQDGDGKHQSICISRSAKVSVRGA